MLELHRCSIASDNSNGRTDHGPCTSDPRMSNSVFGTITPSRIFRHNTPSEENPFEALSSQNYPFLESKLIYLSHVENCENTTTDWAGKVH
jgi:hypothetical protein